MAELVQAVQKRHAGMDEDTIKAVVLPLVSSREIELTSDRKLKAKTGALAAASQP
ncbi:MAG: hypothetical protein K2X27_12550 [Candidatus Obscuribacterales bacterium]|nr:hypothetical protein [Candidatus Obscuribacterales bacterium]